jgi:hypothetical protein
VLDVPAHCSLDGGSALSGRGEGRPPARAKDLRRSPVSSRAGLLVAIGAASIASAQTPAAGPLGIDLDVRADASFTYDTNVNRAPNGQQRLTDQFYAANLTASHNFPLTASTRILVDGVVGGDLTRFYPKLGRVFGEVQGVLQYRESAAFSAPTFSLFGRGSADHFGSDQRSGYRYSVGASIVQPVTDRINLTGVLAHTGRNANSAVFDSSDNSVQLGLDYSVGPHGTLYLTGQYRWGDVVSTGQESLANLDIAKVFVPDDAYTNPQLFSYRFDARTVIATLGYNLPVESRGALDFSWTWAQSTPTQSPGFPGAGTPRYVDNQLMVVFVWRF